MEDKILYAHDGMIYTNGEVYGVQIHLADGVDRNSFYEITMEEYDRILAEQEKEAMP